MCEALASEITAVKVSFSDPIILVAGDIGDAFVVEENMTVVKTGRTRGDNTLDLIFTNTPESVQSSRVFPPLESGDGTASEHQDSGPQNKRLHLD